MNIVIDMAFGGSGKITTKFQHVPVLASCPYRYSVAREFFAFARQVLQNAERVEVVFLPPSRFLAGRRAQSF